MPSPADKLGAVLLDTLNQWVKDNPGLAKQSVNVTDPGGGGDGGGGSGDPLATILGLVGIGLALNPEVDAVTAALEGVSGHGGSEGTAFLSGWFVAETMLKFADPYTRVLTHAAEASIVSQIFEADMAAELQAKGIITHDEAVSEAAGGGFDGQHVSWMVEHAYSYPGLAETLRAWNLGLLDEGSVTLAMQRAGVPDQYIEPLKGLRRQYLSVADLALATLRGDIEQADAESYAALLGMDQADFDLFIQNTGEPPGLMQLLEAYRRGYIDQPRLLRGIRQSRVRDEWSDVVLDLRYERMSAADAVDATVQNHLTSDQGQAAAALAGLFPDDFPVLLETAGEPLSRTEMTELVNRNEATVDDYDQAMRESRLKDKYIPFAEKLLVKLIPYRTINTIVGHGVESQEWGIRYLQKLGYTADDAASLMATSTSAKTAHIKALTEGQILTLYEAKAITEADAKTQLGTIGYSEDEAGFILSYTVAKRAVSEQNKAVNALRAAFMAHRIAKADAQTAMDSLGVPSAQRDQLVTDWEIERGAQVKELTVAEIASAVYYEVVPFADAQAKLVEMGYANNDAKVLLSAANHGTPTGVTIDPLSGSTGYEPVPTGGLGNIGGPPEL